MNPTAPSPGGASPALAAFLGGIARRALVLAELQCGDAPRGDAAAMAALPGFAAAASTQPMARWPRLFWSGLLAQPGLRPAGDVRWPAGFAGLAGVGPGARAALLLWLVAGLGEEEAAAALGVAVPAWRLALQRAAPHDAQGQLDADARRALEAEVREALRNVSPERLRAWERASEAVVAGGSARPAIQVRDPAWRQPDSPPRRTRWWLPALGLCVLALAATFLWPWGGLVPGSDPGHGTDTTAAALVERTPLPESRSPEPHDPDETAALLLHPDFELLIAGGDTPLLHDLDFYAWYAAQAGAVDAPGGAADAQP